MKYSQSQKLKIVKEHIVDGVPLHELETKYNFSCSSIKYQCHLYHLYGEKHFDERTEARTYTREEKLKAIKRVLETGEAVHSVALELELNDPTILRDWIAKYNNDGESAIQDTHSRSHYLVHEDRLDRIAEKSLKDRLQYLEAENEYLKKFYSLTQKRRKQSKKK